MEEGNQRGPFKGLILPFKKWRHMTLKVCVLYTCLDCVVMYKYGFLGAPDK